MLPDALKTRCGRCSKIQKEKSLDVITRLYYQHPKLYTALAERYDPTGEYTRNFERWFDDQNALKPQPIYRQRQSDERDLQEVRRSPSSSSFQSNSNNLPTERRRIPATTTTEPTTTTRRITSTRATLRTTTATVRTTTQRQEQPRFFEEVAPVFRTAPVAPPLPTYTAPPSPIFTAPLTSRPIFREPPRAQPVTTTRSPIIRFQPPAVVREFPVTQGTQESTFRQSNVFNESPRQPVRPTQGTSVFRESTATPQYVTASQRFAPAEENSRPSVIFREATTSRSQPDPTPIVRDQSNSFEREPTAVTNPPKTSNVVPASDPQVFRSREREQSSDSPSVRPSVPVRDSPVYRPQTNFQANQRTPIFRNPTAAVPNSPSREQPPNQEVRNFSRDSEAISGRNEPVSNQ